MDWLNLSVNIISGGLVGYITNSLAIKMLFKEYPVIGGGEVIKDRTNLEHAMSELVEERLITPETVLDEFDTDAFKASFEALILKIINHDLRRNLEKFNTLGEIEGYHKTSDNLKSFLLGNRESIMETILNALFDNIMIKDFLSQSQLNTLIERLFSLFSNSLVENLNILLLGLHSELEQMPISDVLSTDIIRQLGHNLIQDLHQVLAEQLKDELDHFYNSLDDILAIETLIKQLESHIFAKNLAELLGEASSSNTANHLLERLRQFMNSPKGQQILTEFLNHIIQLLKEIEKPISSFLNEELEERLLDLIDQHLPTILDRLDNWVTENKRELQELILEAINEHLKTENVVKHLTATIFSEQLTERYRIIKNVLSELRKIAGQSTHDVVQLGARFLDNTQIKDLVEYLDSRVLDRKALTHTLIRMLNNYLPRLDLSFLDTIFHTSIGELPGIESLQLAEKFRTFLQPYLKKQIFERFLFDESLEKALKAVLEQWLESLESSQVAHLIPGGLNSHADLLSEFISSQPFKEFAIEKISQPIPELIEDKNLKVLINENIHQTLWRKLDQLYQDKVDGFLNQFQGQKVGSLYHRLAQLYFNLSNHQLFARRTREAVVSFMINMIREYKLFEGKIYVVVKESFSRFSDQEMQAEMENFMGEELKPIALLGAFLGSIVGGILSFAWLVPYLQPVTAGLWAFITFPLAFALTGIGTNWLAIKMLFRPYQKKFFPFTKIQMPFTPAVFIKNKAALGDSMARFIDQKLLSKTNMVEILERYHPKWKEVIKSVVSHNDYAQLDERIQHYTHDNYDSITPLILELGFDQMNQNQVVITDYLLEEARALRIDNQDIQAFRQELETQIDDSKNYFKVLLKGLGEKYSSSPHSLNYLLSEPILKHSKLWLHEQFTHSFHKFYHLLGQEQHLNDVLFLIANRLEPMLNTRLENVAPLSSLNLTALIEFCLDFLRSEQFQSAIIDFIQSRLTQEFSGTTKIGDVLDGRLINLLSHEADFLMDILSSYMIEVAANNKGRIVHAVARDIQRQGMLEIMLVNFGGVRRDIRRVVDVIIDQKLSPYLDHKSEDLKLVLKRFILKDLSEMAFEQLGIHDNLFNLETIQSVLKERILNQIETQKNLEKLAAGLLEELMHNLNIQEVLSTVNLKSPGEILKRFDEEIDLIRLHLIECLDSKETVLIDACQIFLRLFLERYLFEIQPTQIFHDVSLTDMKHSLSHLIEQLYQTQTFKSIKNTLLNQFLSHLKDGDITAFVDPTILKDDVICSIDQLTSRIPGRSARSIRFQHDIQEALRDITLNFVSILNTTVENETKVAIENLVVDSLIDGLRENNREVLEPIDFEVIVKREVMAMNAERIQSLFDFAQHIFRALIWYGAMGGVVGIIAALIQIYMNL